jgi:hypothetical protein
MDNLAILHKVRKLMQRLDDEYVNVIDIYTELQSIEADLINTLPAAEDDIEFLNSLE